MAVGGDDGAVYDKRCRRALTGIKGAAEIRHAVTTAAGTGAVRERGWGVGLELSTGGE